MRMPLLFSLDSDTHQGKDEEDRRKFEPEEPQTELLTAELKKQSHQSVSKALGEKLLYDTIEARHSSMVRRKKLQALLL